MDDKYIYTGSKDNTVRVWAKGSWKQVAVLKGHSYSIMAVAVDDNYIYSGSHDKTVRVWTKGSWKQVATLKHMSWVDAVAVDDNYIYSGSDDKTIRVWRKLKSKLMSYGWSIKEGVDNQTLIYLNSQGITVYQTEHYYILQQFYDELKERVLRDYLIPVSEFEVPRELLIELGYPFKSYSGVEYVYLPDSLNALNEKLSSLLQKKFIISISELGLSDRFPLEIFKELGYQIKKYSNVFYLYMRESLNEFNKLIRNQLQEKPIMKLSELGYPEEFLQDILLDFGYIIKSYKESKYVYSPEILIEHLQDFNKSFEEILLADISEYWSVPEFLIKFIVSDVIVRKNLNYKIKGDMLILGGVLSGSHMTQINKQSGIPTEQYSVTDITGSNISLSSTMPNQSVPTQAFGEYTIERVLGQGGYGTVFQARDSNGRMVAIKVMTIDDAKMKRKFLREVGFWKNLRHANIVRIIDYTVDPQPYLVMELMEGDLRSQLRQGTKFDMEDIFDIILQVAMGLKYAHDEFQYIHRDIKPENILYKDITYKLTDWGLAKLSGAETRSGYSGSIPYSAPEQFDPEFGEIGPWTDVWQLGVVFYELLTGKLPFGKDLSEVIKKVRSEPPEISDGIPHDISILISKMLEKDPRSRVSIKDVIQILNKHL